MSRFTSRTALAGLLTLTLAAAAAAQERKTPYWASLNTDEALMRSGPGKQFPGLWLYKRKHLPVRVVAVHQNWRRVQDPSGAEGWMDQILLTAERTAVIRPGPPRPLRADPSPSAPVRYLAAPGVVGSLSDCGDGWCKLKIDGRIGHVRTSDIWGVAPREELD